MISHDTTEPLRAESALHRGEKLFRAIFENASDGIMLIDESGTLIAWNPAMERITGIAAAQVVGQPAWEAQRLVLLPERDTPERTARARKAILQVLSGENTWLLDQMMEARIRTLAGEERVLQEHYSLMDAIEGRYLAVFSRDITDIKRAQEQHIADTLNQQRMDILTTFIRDASHEFRTPLTIINTKLYFIERLAQDARQQAHLNDISQQVDSIVRLLDSLVTITRLEIGPVDALAGVDVGQTLKQAAAAPALRQPEAPRLVMDIPPGLPLVSGGPDDLSEAFAQIIDNAIRYTPASGAVLISAQANGETVTVTVEDTGIGIPDEALPRVFDLFFRLDAAHSTRGFGLGLSIARLIVERCGGHIAVESKAGSGTQVRVALPVYHG